MKKNFLFFIFALWYRHQNKRWWWWLYLFFLVLFCFFLALFVLLFGFMMNSVHKKLCIQSFGMFCNFMHCVWMNVWKMIMDWNLMHFYCIKFSHFNSWDLWYENFARFIEFSFSLFNRNIQQKKREHTHNFVSLRLWNINDMKGMVCYNALRIFRGDDEFIFIFFFLF